MKLYRYVCVFLCVLIFIILTLTTTSNASVIIMSGDVENTNKQIKVGESATLKLTTEDIIVTPNGGAPQTVRSSRIFQIASSDTDILTCTIPYGSDGKTAVIVGNKAGSATITISIKNNYSGSVRYTNETLQVTVLSDEASTTPNTPTTPTIAELSAVDEDNDTETDPPYKYGDVDDLGDDDFVVMVSQGEEGEPFKPQIGLNEVNDKGHFVDKNDGGYVADITVNDRKFSNDEDVQIYIATENKGLIKARVEYLRNEKR